MPCADLIVTPTATASPSPSAPVAIVRPKVDWDATKMADLRGLQCERRDGHDVCFMEDSQGRTECPSFVTSEYLRHPPVSGPHAVPCVIPESTHDSSLSPPPSMLLTYLDSIYPPPAALPCEVSRFQKTASQSMPRTCTVRRTASQEMSAFSGGRTTSTIAIQRRAHGRCVRHGASKRGTDTLFSLSPRHPTPPPILSCSAPACTPQSPKRLSLFDPGPRRLRRRIRVALQLPRV